MSSQDQTGQVYSYTTYMKKIHELEKLGYKHPVKDVVDHPPHYNKGKVECIDAIESAVSDLNGIEAVCTANAIKYLYRWKTKDGVESLKKARWYLNKLIDTLEEQ
jgi:hypothetical protein